MPGCHAGRRSALSGSTPWSSMTRARSSPILMAKVAACWQRAMHRASPLSPLPRPPLDNLVEEELLHRAVARERRLHVRGHLHVDIEVLLLHATRLSGAPRRGFRASLA